MREVELVKNTENYSVGNLGKFDELGQYEYYHPLVKFNIQGKVFLGEALDMTSIEMSVQLLKAGGEIPFDHKHKTNEEVYVVIKGNGEFIVDDETIQGKEGSLINYNVSDGYM